MEVIKMTLTNEQKAKKYDEQMALRKKYHVRRNAKLALCEEFCKKNNYLPTEAEVDTYLKRK